MKKSVQYKGTILFFLRLLILTALAGVFAVVWYRCYADVIVQPYFRKGNWLVIGIYALLLGVVLQIYGGYRIGYYKRGALIYSAILSVLFVNAVTYLQISLIGRMWMFPLPMLLKSAVDVLAIVLWAFFADWIYHLLYPPHQMLLVYSGESAESLVYKMSTRDEKYEICEAINVERGFEAVSMRIAEYDAVIICDVKSGLRNKLLKFCYAHGVRTYLTPKISDILVRGADSINLFDTPLLLCRNFGFTIEQQIFKRIMDVALSIMALVLSSPVLLLTALAVKLNDGGPILYKQTRLTKDGKMFEIYKFRSMVVDAERDCGARLASEDDDRVTPLGRWLRRVRIDEFPQLFNILRGDMSIVGPRPERPEIDEEYARIMPEFRFRLKVKAGLTGYAQVLGKYNTTPYDKLKLDLTYIENYSVLLDLKLIMMTVKILFLPSSTEGISKKARTAALTKTDSRPD